MSLVLSPQILPESAAFSELVERVDLLAIYVGKLEAENAELRRCADTLALHVGLLTEAAATRIDRELRAKAPSPTPLRPALSIVRQRQTFTRRRIA